jgi:transposase
MSQYDLTDFEWRVIEPLLPTKPRGVSRVDDRRVLNGIFWVLRSGAPWRDVPKCLVLMRLWLRAYESTA